MNMESIDREGKDDREEDLVKILRSVDCQLLKTGCKPVHLNYFVCSCDPEEKELICSECIKSCHKNHKIIKEIECTSICQCGMNSHQSFSDNFDKDSEYVSKCMFSEWSNVSQLYVYYTSSDGTNLCMFCANFCEDIDQLNRIEGQTTIPPCGCLHNTHVDKKAIFKKINDIRDLYKLVFENLTPTHLINIMFKSKKSYMNLYSIYVKALAALREQIKLPGFTYESLDENAEFNWLLANLYVLLRSVKKMYYLNDSNKMDLIDPEFILNILQSKTISIHISNFKLHAISVFLKTYMKRDFVKCPSLKLSDIEQMNPLQRLMIISNIKDEQNILSQYIAGMNIRFLDSILSILNKLNRTDEKTYLSYQLMRRLYQILKIYAKYYLFNQEQLARFCYINDEVVFKLQDAIKSVSHDSELKKQMMECQYKVLHDITTAITYLVYSYNDQVVESFLRKKKEINKIEFYHSNSEIGKLVSRNSINILSFIRSNTTGQQEISKLVKSILKNCMKLLSQSINHPDIYSSSLKRLLDKNKEIYLLYISGEYGNEKGYVSFIKEKTEQMERFYQQFFECSIDRKELVNLIQSLLKEYWGFIKINNYQSYLKQLELAPMILDSDRAINRDDYVVQEKKGRKISVLLKTYDIFQADDIQKLNNKFDETEAVTIMKYKLLINKSFFLYSLVNVIHVFQMEHFCKENTYKDFYLEDNLFNEIITFLCFYIQNCPENCIILFSSEIITLVKGFFGNQLIIFLQLMNSAIQILIKNNYEMSSNNNFIYLIKRAILNLEDEGENNIPIIEQIISLLLVSVDLKFVNQDDTNKKIRKLIKQIFEKIPMLGDFKNYLLKQSHKSGAPSKMETELISSQFQGEDVRIPTPDAANKKFAAVTFDVYISGVKSVVLEKLMHRFLELVNNFFDGNATLNESEFLKKIFKVEEIPKILNDRMLKLSLRTEIFIFYRMTYIDVIIENSNIEDYRSLVINNISKKNSDEDNSVFNFFSDLMSINLNFASNLGIESAVLKHELKFFKEIVAYAPDTSEHLSYIENGILQTLIVHMNKYMSVIANLAGDDCLRLYELVYYFLNLKRFIILNKSMLQTTRKVDFVEIFKNENTIVKSENFSMINKDLKDNDLVEVEYDMAQMTYETFEILNYQKIYSIYTKHLDGLISAPKNKSLKKLFRKKDVCYTEDELAKIEKKLKAADFLKNGFEKRVYSCLIKYFNDKYNLESHSFIQNLNEKNVYFDTNYRYQLIKSILFLSKHNKLSEKYQQNSLRMLFRLLQYDTVPVQQEVESLYKEDYYYLNFNEIVDMFFSNFLSLILSSWNPSSFVNFDYYSAITVIKILKYLCEEHNTKFQGIFFRELKIQYLTAEKTEESLTLFDFMLAVLGKIVLLAKWDRVNFEGDDNKIRYLYDIFFVIMELLIEMIQGTQRENLESILSANQDIKNNFFVDFLHSVKPLIIKDDNHSEVVYKTRNDFMDFICAFLEEKSTPKRLINQISDVFLPKIVFETLINTMKKTYLADRNKDKLKIFRKEKFDNVLCDYFTKKFFFDLEFCDTIQFGLCNRMYQYIKLLALENENEEAISLITQVSKTSLDGSDQNYYLVKFFESITRSVFVQKDDELIRVIFTINPLIPHLSNNTMNEFYNNVNREMRYTKLIALVENCDYFYDEINYNADKANKNLILRLLNKINYFILEAAVFLITVTINLIMLIRLTNDEIESGDLEMNTVIRALSYLNIFLNTLFVLLWFYSKLPLYITIDSKRVALEKKIDQSELTFWNKVEMLFKATFYRNEINGFLWNIIFSSAGVVKPINNFLFSVQLLIIINLSNTLKNIVKSVQLKYKQLISTSIFIVILSYVFASLAFFFLAEDFYFNNGEGVS
jgi:hypothetical protein